MMSWFPSNLDLSTEDWLRVAREMGLMDAEFVESETPHSDAMFANRALRLLKDVGLDHGAGLGRFEPRVTKSKRHGTASLRPSGAFPIVKGKGNATHYVDFINDETAYLFTSSGPALAGHKSLHLVHLVEGEWALGKKMSEYIS